MAVARTYEKIASAIHETVPDKNVGSDCIRHSGHHSGRVWLLANDASSGLVATAPLKGWPSGYVPAPHELLSRLRVCGYCIWRIPPERKPPVQGPLLMASPGEVKVHHIAAGKRDDPKPYLHEPGGGMPMIMVPFKSARVSKE